jgi:two-component system, NtrC family, nitrogen regulation response regulator GlnG
VASTRRSRAALDVETVEPPKTDDLAPDRYELVLTIAGHSDVARVGEVAQVDGPIEVSRVSPEFAMPGSSDLFPLADPAISRKPVLIDPRAYGEAELASGVTIELAGRAVLLLHQRKVVRPVGATLDLIGDSSPIHELRQEILRIADLRVPVLIRGETGTGKELVAQALHRASTKKEGPYLSMNMAAIHASVAASELFGHTKGAFTGADQDREGYFARADGGTLFMDEIGETPIEVQVMLLRTLETGAIQPVGGGERLVDVRLITATDADLETLVRSGGFRAPLLHRLAGYDVRVPTLRERRDDIGRLLIHFLRDELEKLGAGDRLTLENPSARPWLGAEVVALLVRYDWPGNIRQLRNVARQLAITHHDGYPRVDEQLQRLLPSDGDAIREEIAPKPSSKKRRKPSDVTEEELAAALKRNKWKLEQTADELSISRASLYMLIDKSTRFRKAKDLGKEELLAAHAEANGDLDRMSEKLEVSKGGLRLRMKEILGE